MDDEISEFLEYFWGTDSGTEQLYVYLPVKTEGRWRAVMFKWPNAKRSIIQHILKESAEGNDVYFAPALFKNPSPKKESVLGARAFWIDLDGNADEARKLMGDTVPKPTLVVQSSLENHEHWYWRLDKFVTDVSVLEGRNRDIAYFLNADTSGWDADQVLRPVGSVNNKRGGDPVFILDWEL